MLCPIGQSNEKPPLQALAKWWEYVTDNKNLTYGFLTGILRIAQESIFSGLNNLTVNSVLDDDYDQYFGFTGSEVRDMLAYYGFLDKESELKEWYDGYLFGSTEIYNPWSVINYISKDCIPQAYWVNTGKNEILEVKTWLEFHIPKKKSNYWRD